MQLLAKENWPGHVKSRNYDVTKGIRLAHFCEKWQTFAHKKAISTSTRLLLTILGQE